ncbi:MAG: transglutaminase domain protein [Acidimicrobiaceae bacterium]|nr:transglutaminase domain protein [Acidimicrobiaceae bacterium]
MWIRVGCEFEFRTAAPNPSLWQIRARQDGAHRVLEEEWSAPSEASWYLDAYGNVCDRLMLPEGLSSLRYDALAEVPDEPDPTDPSATISRIEDLPDDAFLYLLPSRYCLPELLRDDAWELFGSTKPNWERVDAVSDWIHENVTYLGGTSTPSTTALDVFQSREGVCRDFTQLGISFCRALNIPARYVAGYLPDIAVEPPQIPMDFCSWFEAWLDGRWWTFDPRNNEPRIGRVVIARGRDALDAAMVTTWGAVELLQMTVWADEATNVV